MVFRYQASRNRFDMFCTLGFLYFVGMFLIPIEFGYRSESPHVYSAEIAIMNEAISERPKTACPYEPPLQTDTEWKMNLKHMPKQSKYCKMKHKNIYIYELINE